MTRQTKAIFYPCGAELFVGSPDRASQAEMLKSRNSDLIVQKIFNIRAFVMGFVQKS